MKNLVLLVLVGTICLLSLVKCHQDEEDHQEEGGDPSIGTRFGGDWYGNPRWRHRWHNREPDHDWQGKDRRGHRYPEHHGDWSDHGCGHGGPDYHHGGPHHHGGPDHHYWGHDHGGHDRHSNRGEPDHYPGFQPPQNPGGPNSVTPSPIPDYKPPSSPGEFPGAQDPGSFPGSQNPGSFPDSQNPGSFPGSQNPVNPIFPGPGPTIVRRVTTEKPREDLDPQGALDLDVRFDVDQPSN